MSKDLRLKNRVNIVHFHTFTESQGNHNYKIQNVTLKDVSSSFVVFLLSMCCTCMSSQHVLHMKDVSSSFVASLLNSKLCLDKSVKYTQGEPLQKVNYSE